MDEESKLLPYVIGIGFILLMFGGIAGLFGIGMSSDFGEMMAAICGFYLCGGMISLIVGFLPTIKPLEYIPYFEDYKDSTDKIIIIGYAISLIVVIAAILINN